MLLVTWVSAVVFAGCSGSLHHLQLGSLELAKIRQMTIIEIQILNPDALLALFDSWSVKRGVEGGGGSRCMGLTLTQVRNQSHFLVAYTY